MGLSSSLLVLATLVPGQLPPPDFYQDFRGSRPMLPSLQLLAPDADAVSTPEDGGLRITLPATRQDTQPVRLATKSGLSGDFELTGTFELLAADRPSSGYGVGVTLNVATDVTRKKFAKVGRLLRVKEGSVFLSEFWNKERPKDYRVQSIPTEARSGRLRLVRKGATLHYLAADGPKNDFREIYQGTFGTEDLAQVHFVVSSSGSPGNAVDARLVDLRISSGGFIPDHASEPAPPPEPGRAGALWGTLAALILVLLGAGMVAVLRSRGKRCGPATTGEPLAPDPSPSAVADDGVAVRCPSCHKRLKVPGSMLGKKIKCPGCASAFIGE
jgi:Protein of unknown function (DUF1583)